MSKQDIIDVFQGLISEDSGAPFEPCPYPHPFGTCPGQDVPRCPGAMDIHDYEVCIHMEGGRPTATVRIEDRAARQGYAFHHVAPTSGESLDQASLMVRKLLAGFTPVVLWDAWSSGTYLA